MAELTSNDGQPDVATPQCQRRHGWLWWSWHVIVWTGTLTLALIAAARILYHDGLYYLTWCNAFTRYIYLPAYLGLAWAVWQRRGILALASAAIVACHLVWLAPDFLRDRRFDLPVTAPGDTPAKSPSLRIFFANVLQGSQEYDAMFQEVADADPDVLIFAEWGWAWDKAFKQSPVSADYAYGNSVTRPHYGMVNVFSKLPIKNELMNFIDGRLVDTVDLPIGSQTLRVIGLHAARPLAPDQRDYLSYWTQMIARLSAETGPLVVIGDFNATEHSLFYWQLKSMGLRSVHDDRGRGYATTWPNDMLGISLIRIDQAFLSREVECQRIVEGRGSGSDHKPVIVDVRVRGSVQVPPPAAKRAS
jgi:endonuclease/exonuclease/phosphatase (EEP) superfamily protein YafD